MTIQNTNAVNPSVILPFAAICSFEAPTTELDPDFVPCVWLCVGEFETFLEAKAACYFFETHPALIAMHVSQCFKDGGCAMSTNTNRAYKKGTNLMIQGSLICQSIDKQRNLDRFWARQKPKTPVNAAQTAQECRDIATAISADIGRHIEAEVNRV